jgi:hypothetical protein
MIILGVRSSFPIRNEIKDVKKVFPTFYGELVQNCTQKNDFLVTK